MKVLLVVLSIFVIAVLALAMLKRTGPSETSGGPWPFYAKRPLSPPEQVLYHRLIKALPEHIVLAQGTTASTGLVTIS